MTETVTQKTASNVKKSRDIYKILIVGSSGKGKSYLFRNMNPKSTGFINVENKPLPFKNNFAHHARPKAFAGIMKALEDYSKNDDINVIIIDSLSAAFEILVEEARNMYTGWDVWNFYNKKVSELMKMIKGIEKEVFVTAHYETLNVEGEPEKRVKVKAKEWEGLIEKEFTIVMYAQAKYKGDIPEYFLSLSGEGLSAKCPPDIFGDGVYKIESDGRVAFDKILAFAGA